MKHPIRILISILTLCFWACNSPSHRQENAQEKLVTKEPIVETSKQRDQPEENNDCIRGQAEPIIQRDDYPNTKFTLQQDSLTAIETVNFDNGDKLVINNWGCEYYVLTFRFETTKFQEDTTNLEYWFRAADRLMTGMLSGIDAPINIKKGVNYLSSYIDRDKKNNYKTLKLGDEIDFGINEIRNFVSVDRIGKLTDKKFAVTISFTVGPL
jgi:hypothetical protein